MVKLRATRRMFVGGRLINPGDLFELPDGTEAKAVLGMGKAEPADQPAAAAPESTALEPAAEQAVRPPAGKRGRKSRG